MATGVPAKRRKSPATDGSAVRTDSMDLGVQLDYPGKQPTSQVLCWQPAEAKRIWRDGNDRNRLYFGENAGLLAHLASDSAVCGHVRLVYIDPPFSTQTAFHSRKLDEAYDDVLAGAEYVEFLRQRIVLLHRLLADDGSLYLHLDGKMVFPMKLVLDEVFGPEGFRNCITRKKCTSKNYTRRQYGNIADYLLFYTKSAKHVWNRPFEPWTDERASEYQYVEPGSGRRFMKVPVHAPGVRHGETGEPWRGRLPPPGKHWQFPPRVLDEMDKRGEIYWSANGNPRRKVYLDASQGVGVQDIWLGFRDAHNQNIQITGYPTEKNPGLLKRVIEASSNPGDLVLDCFAGSGTTMAVAHQLGRRWIGIDKGLEAFRTTLRRFSGGTERMGDYVETPAEEEGPKALELFSSLARTRAPKKSSNHTPVRGFSIWAETRLVERALPAVEEWLAAIGCSAEHGSMVARYADEVEQLRTRDSRLAPIIDRVGPCRLAARADGFAALVDAVISQQVSKKAAESIRLKVKALFRSGQPNASELLGLSDARLAGAGLSQRKLLCLRELARRLVDGQLDLQALRDKSDDDVIAALTSVKGIGRWTAEMYLLFTLNRLDVFPSSDGALMAAIRGVYALDDGSDLVRLQAISDRWRPYRSIACWYFYAHLSETRLAG